MRSRWSTAQSNPELCSGQAVPQMLRLQNPTLWVFSPGVEVWSDHMGRYKRAAQSHSAKRYTKCDIPRPLNANALSLMTELAEVGSDVSMNYLLGKQGTKLRQSSGLPGQNVAGTLQNLQALPETHMVTPHRVRNLHLQNPT